MLFPQMPDRASSGPGPQDPVGKRVDPEQQQIVGDDGRSRGARTRLPWSGLTSSLQPNVQNHNIIRSSDRAMGWKSWSTSRLD